MSVLLILKASTLTILNSSQSIILTTMNAIRVRMPTLEDSKLAETTLICSSYKPRHNSLELQQVEEAACLEEQLQQLVEDSI